MSSTLTKDRAMNKCPVPFARNSPFDCFAQNVPDTYLSLIAKLRFQLPILLGLTIVFSLLTTRDAVAFDPFAEYDLVMYERPGFPVAEVEEFFSPGLKPLWIKALKRPDAELQRMVIDTIAIAHQRGLSGLDEIRPELVALLQAPDQSTDIIRSAASALIAMDSQQDADLLAKVASERNATVSQIVEPALAKWKSPAMLDVWLARISDSSSSNMLLLLAINGLGELESTAASAALKTKVQKSMTSIGVRMASARALGKIHTDGLVDLATVLAAQDSKPKELGSLLAIEVLNRHADTAASTLVASLLTNPSSVVQAEALGQLYKMDPLLIERQGKDKEFFQSPDVNVRTWGARSIVATANVKRIGALSTLLDDVNPALRREVARGLIQLAGNSKVRDEVLARVSEILAGNSWRGCEQACVVLTRLDHKPAGQRMVALLSHERGEVRVATAWGLTQLRIKEHLPAMLKHAQSVYNQFSSEKMNDGMPGYSLQVAHLFIAFGDQQYGEAESLLRAYLPKRFELGYQSRPAAVWALGLIHEGAPKEDLVGILLDRFNDVASMIPETDEVRQMCAISFGRMRAEAVIPELRKYSNGLSLSGRACAWAMEKLSGEVPRSIPQSRSEIEDWFLSPIPPVVPLGSE